MIYQITGPNNAVNDVPGIEVGHYQENNSGTTVILARNGAVGAVGAGAGSIAGGSTVNPKTGELYGAYLEIGDEFGDYALTDSKVFVVVDDSEPVKIQQLPALQQTIN